MNFSKTNEAISIIFLIIFSIAGLKIGGKKREINKQAKNAIIIQFSNNWKLGFLFKLT